MCILRIIQLAKDEIDNMRTWNGSASFTKQFVEKYLKLTTRHYVTKTKYEIAVKCNERLKHELKNLRSDYKDLKACYKRLKLINI